MENRKDIFFDFVSDGKKTEVDSNEEICVFVKSFFEDEWWLTCGINEKCNINPINIRTWFIWIDNFNLGDIDYHKASTSLTIVFSKIIPSEFDSSTASIIKTFLDKVFDKLDMLCSKKAVNVNYASFFSAFMQIKAILINNKFSSPGLVVPNWNSGTYNASDEDYTDFETIDITKHYLLFNEILCDQLEFRKEKFKEIAIFNSVSKNKFDIDKLDIKLQDIKSKNNFSNYIPKYFTDIWFDKSSIGIVLDYFIENSPEKLISLKENNYSYNDLSNKKQIKLAGFLTALSYKKWISVSTISSPNLIKLINDFFGLHINLNDNNFKPQMLLKLSESGTKEHERHVKPLLMFIKNKS